MPPSLRALLIFLVATSAVAAACGGNVVVDGATTGTGTGATTGSGGSTLGSGGAVTGFGGGLTTGFGGGITTTTGFGGSVTTTTVTTTMVGACTDPLDANIFQNTVAFPESAKCALANLGNSQGLVMCLTANVGVSSACADCMAEDLTCAVAHCPNPCSQDPASPGCASCRQINCEAQFVACSGLAHDTGITDCAGVLGQGPTLTPWQRGLADSDFTTPAAESAYQVYDACACGGSCGPDCAGYCNGQLGSAKCGNCIATVCAMAAAECMAN
jgi:hypothetical protein